MSKRILWARNKGEYTFYFFANFELSKLTGPRPVGFNDEELEKMYGEKGFELLRLIRDIDGVADPIELSSFQLTVHRLAGWKPGEVFPKVVDAIKYVYGSSVVFECQNRLKDVVTLTKNIVS